MTIFEPYGEALISTEAAARQMRREGWATKIKETGVQDPDDTVTCGYQVLAWVKHIQAIKQQHPDYWRNNWQPVGPLSAAIKTAWRKVQRKRKELEETEARIDREKQRSRRKRTGCKGNLTRQKGR